MLQAQSEHLSAEPAVEKSERLPIPPDDPGQELKIRFLFVHGPSPRVYLGTK